MRIRRILLLLMMLPPLGACTTYSLQELRSAPPKGTPFQAALAVKYLKFSEDEAANYDWADSTYFASKGLTAAYGSDVSPENPDNWDLPAGKRAELEAARERLLAVIRAQAQAKPSQVAEAQYYFDCWLENQDEYWQPDEIAWCRDGFAEIMNRLEAAAEDKAAAADEEEMPGEMSGELPAETPEDAPQKDAYIVFFGMNRDGLDTGGERIVDGVARELQESEREDYIVTLNGHTDTLGSKRYNQELSRRRAEAVLEALVERGIPKALIRAFGFGETDPKYSTQDGVAEPKNRRVEIFIGGG